MHFWLWFVYRSGFCSGPRPRNRKCTYQREAFSCCVWLAPSDNALAKNNFHNCSFAASAGIQIKGSTKTKTISEQKVFAIFEWQGQRKYLSGRFPPVAPYTDSTDSISWVEGCYRSIKIVDEKYISIDGFYYRSLCRAIQN